MTETAVIDFEGDIFIPAARPDVVNEANVHRLKAKLVVQGANIPVTPGAERYLHDQGVLCVPDFIANAGGVICAAMEYQGASPAAVFADHYRKSDPQYPVGAGRVENEKDPAPGGGGATGRPPGQESHGL